MQRRYLTIISLSATAVRPFYPLLFIPRTVQNEQGNVMTVERDMDSQGDPKVLRQKICVIPTPPLPNILKPPGHQLRSRTRPGTCSNAERPSSGSATMATSGTSGSSTLTLPRGTPEASGAAMYMCWLLLMLLHPFAQSTKRMGDVGINTALVIFTPCTLVLLMAEKKASDLNTQSH